MGNLENAKDLGQSIYTKAEVNVDFAHKVSSIAGLASLGSSTPTVIVTDTDRGGIFVWSASGTANGGTVFAGSSGYWIRQYSGAVNVKWFGAVGDGVTDDTASLQNAINASTALFFPAGTYKITSQLVGKTKLVLKGAYTQLQETGAETAVTILALQSDLGDGTAMLKLAPGTTQIQSVVVENIKFQSDLSISYNSLSTAGTTGLIGIDPSGIKQGLVIRGCSFKYLKCGIKDVSGHGYIDHTLIDRCAFYLNREAIDFAPTTGINLSDCSFYDSYSIGITNRVTATNCSFNNSSFASNDDSNFKFDVGVFSNTWIEGYNNVLQPSKYLEVNNAYFSECYDNGVGFLKHTIKPQGDNVAIAVKGVRVATNTRLINFSSVVDFTTVSIELVRCYSGTNFGDATISDVYEFTERGGKFLGSLNDNTDWNFGSNLGSILGGVDLDRADTTNYYRMPNLFRKVYWETSISFTLNFQSSVDALETPPIFSDLGAEYAEFTIVGFNNGAGGTVVYYAKVKILNGYGSTWDYVIEGRNAASYSVSLNVIDKYTCGVTIAEAHAGSGEFLIFNGSTSSGKIKFN